MKLVERIRDQRIKSNDGLLPEEPTRDLLESLALGPVIVRGHYEHDLKRFGEQYACGDIQAREQMKDILINLQMTLIITLRSVYMDGMDLDFNALQTSSDDCRVNAGVCLGQLSQRLSDAAKAQAYYPQHISYSSGSSLMPPMSPSLAYSSSRSTHSSVAFPAPRTPDAMTEHFVDLSISPPGHPPGVDRKMSVAFGSSQEPPQLQSSGLSRPAADSQSNVLFVGVHRVDEADDMSMRRRSSQALASDDNILLLFPQPGGPPILSPRPGEEPDRASFVSSGKNSQAGSPDVSRAPSSHRNPHSRDRFGPDDYGEQVARRDGRQYSHGTIYDMYHPPTPEKAAALNSNSYSQRAQASNHNTLEHVRYLQENSRPPRPQPRSDSLNAPTKMNHDPEYYRRSSRAPTDTSATSHYQPRSTVSIAAPLELHHDPRCPLPQSPNQVSPTVFSPADRASSIHTIASSAPSVSASTNTGRLTLPTDKNLLGFCKGAFRLQAGLERKAFSLANRPAGYSGMVTFWRCEKCNFEGPVHNSVGIAEGKKKGKPERSFDPRIRISASGGVRYKWAFLARCHVALKGIVPHDAPASRDGGFGSFGCIFCCAEGKNRGWFEGGSHPGINPGGSIKGNGSMRSGHTANTANTAIKVDTASSQATPIFGNVASFMQHLESVHRPQDGWPNAEMVGRFKVVVGRVAGVDEDGWEVNFLPFGDGVY